MKGFQFIPAGTKLDFWGHRFIAYGLSLIVIFGSLGLVATKGINFGIDFTGGTLIEIQTPSAPDLGTMRSGLNNLDLGDISLQEFGSPTDLLLRLPQQDGDETVQTAAIEKVRVYLDENYAPVDYRRTEFVGPQVGDELKTQGLIAVLFSLAGMLIYLWVRFEWQFGVAAVAALTHDVIGTLGLFALTGMTFDLASLAAVLTIVGYSINDTVVIFDRIRETLRKFRKEPFTSIMNRAINDTLARTLMTGVTTLMALGALWLFGGEVIRGFIVALIFGVVIGTHSSIFVAAPLLNYMKVRTLGDEAVETPAT